MRQMMQHWRNQATISANRGDEQGSLEYVNMLRSEWDDWIQNLWTVTWGYPIADLADLGPDVALED